MHLRLLRRRQSIQKKFSDGIYHLNLGVNALQSLRVFTLDIIFSTNTFRRFSDRSPPATLDARRFPPPRGGSLAGGRARHRAYGWRNTARLVSKHHARLEIKPLGRRSW